MAEGFLPRMSRGVVFPPGAPPIHARRYRHGTHFSHDHEFVEIAIVLAGAGVHSSSHGEVPMHPGDVFVLHPGVWHGYRSARTFEVYNCCFGAELLSRELGFLRDDAVFGYLLWSGPRTGRGRRVIHFELPRKGLARCKAILDEVGRATDPERPASHAEQIAQLLMFLSELSKHLPSGERSAAEVSAPSHPAVLKAMDLLSREFLREWTLGELGEAAGVNPSYLVRRFKAATGMSPMAYLTRTRVEQAAGMLLQTARPVSEIGARVGWPDANYFARRFKAQMGLTASEYRRRHTPRV